MFDWNTSSKDQDPKGSIDAERLVLTLAEAALDIDPLARAQWLINACASQPQLKSRVESLIQASERDGLDIELFVHLQASSVEEWGTPFDAHSTPKDHATHLAVGAKFGKYRIERFIAAGGMGEVYEARDELLGRRVAIKILSSVATNSRSRRFFDEAGLMSRLEHPGIARIYEWSEAPHGGVLIAYIAMEYIEGRPITQAARDLPDTRARVDLCVQICHAVAHAHSRGVIHRDLKPANILVDNEGKAHVLDFGIASFLDPAARSNLSVTSGSPRPGTLAYMSPEQLRGGADSISTLSDVYSLGLVLYEVLAGKPAVSLHHGPIDVIIHDVLEEDPPALGKVAPDCKGDLEAIVSLATRKLPAARYPSVAELTADLSRFLRDEPVHARVPGAWERLKHIARRRRVMTASIVVGLISLTTGLSIAGLQYQRAINAEIAAKNQVEETRRLAKTLLFDLSDAVSRLPGSASTRALLAERAVEALAPLAKGTKDSNLLAELSEGYTKLASALGVPGDLHMDQFSQTPVLLQAARSLAQQSVEADPRNFRGWMALGKVELTRGSTAARGQHLDQARSAVEAYARAFELCDGRVDSEEGAAAAERLAYSSMAVLSWSGDPSESTAAMKTSNELYLRLIDQRPEVVVYQHSRAMLLRRRAAKQVVTDPNSAEKDLKEAISIFENLLVKEPHEYSSVRHRSLAMVDVAEIYFQRRDSAQALALVEDAVISVEAAAKRDPANTLTRDDHLETPLWRARARITAGRNEPNSSEVALTWFTEAVQILEDGLQHAKSATADPSPRDIDRIERIEKALAEARLMVSQRERISESGKKGER